MSPFLFIEYLLVFWIFIYFKFGKFMFCDAFSSFNFFSESEALSQNNLN